jgi:hypothetical protein
MREKVKMPLKFWWLAARVSCCYWQKSMYLPFLGLFVGDLFVC